jgi:hypothetical protein
LSEGDSNADAEVEIEPVLEARRGETNGRTERADH